RLPGSIAAWTRSSINSAISRSPFGKYRLLLPGSGRCSSQYIGYGCDCFRCGASSPACEVESEEFQLNSRRLALCQSLHFGPGTETNMRKMTRMRLNYSVYEECVSLGLGFPNLPVFLAEHFGQCGDDLIVASLLQALAMRQKIDLTAETY